MGLLSKRTGWASVSASHRAPRGWRGRASPSTTAPRAAGGARPAAATLLAGPEKAKAFAPVPYFWSDQYDVKFASVGMIGPDDDVEIVDGSTADRKFAATYTRAGKLVGAFACNNPRALMQWRTQI